MAMPNLKQIDPIYSFQVIREVPKFRNFVTWPRPRPFWGRFMIVRSRSPSFVSAKFEADQNIRSKVKTGPKISKLGHVTQVTPTDGSIYGLDAVGVRTLCVCQIWSRYLHSFKSYKGSQNFEIRSRDPGHSHLGVILWSGRSRGPSSMAMPNLKQIGPIYSFQSHKGGHKISKFCHVT